MRFSGYFSCLGNSSVVRTHRTIFPAALGLGLWRVIHFAEFRRQRKYFSLLISTHKCTIYSGFLYKLLLLWPSSILVCSNIVHSPHSSVLHHCLEDLEILQAQYLQSSCLCLIWQLLPPFPASPWKKTNLDASSAGWWMQGPQLDAAVFAWSSH